MEKTTKKKVRKAILGVTSVALVAGVTSAITMAMLSDVKNAENTFTATPNLTVQQVEPKWDGNNPADTVSYAGGTAAKNSQQYSSGTHGEDAAKDYVPGTPIDKNPYVINTSKQDEYVAVRVYYQVQCRYDDAFTMTGSASSKHCGKDNPNWHTISPEHFREYFAQTSYAGGAEYNTDSFVREVSDDGYAEYYFYGNASSMEVLPENTATPEVFQKVTPVGTLKACTDEAHADHHMFKVSDCVKCTDPDSKNYIVKTGTLADMPLPAKGDKEVVLAVGDTDGLPQFRIVVQTAAIQTDNINENTDGTDTVSVPSMVKEELKKCFDEVPDTSPLRS